MKQIPMLAGWTTSERKWYGICCRVCE